MDTAAQPPDSPSTLAHDRPCLRCGYNLRGLQPSAVCPECGSPVADSMRGDRLIYADPAYVRRLQVGAGLAEAAVVLFAVSLVSVVFLLILGIAGIWPPALTIGLAIVPPAVGLLTLGGWWLLSAPDPAWASIDQGVTSRRVLRGALVVAALATLAAAAFPGGAPTVPVMRRLGAGGWDIAMLVVVVAGIVAIEAGLRYAGHLADRLDGADLRGRAPGLAGAVRIFLGAWVLAVLPAFAGFVAPAGVMGCATPIWVLVLLAFYGNLVSRLRVGIGEAAAAAEAREGHSP